ncbi:MAG: hypothetical protein HYZ22_07540, partial [Chloroflexi bacterium]|nr:hypothetical protein [Chloroflexota bacterium]
DKACRNTHKRLPFTRGWDGNFFDDGLSVFDVLEELFHFSWGVYSFGSLEVSGAIASESITYIESVNLERPVINTSWLDAHAEEKTRHKHVEQYDIYHSKKVNIA